MSKHSNVSPELVQEGERIMRICNACRYCEGFCAVFPAMERRLTFEESDLNYLANLCHNCTECYYACQYAPPQEFELNFPKTLAEIRLETYRKYAWPGMFAELFHKNGLVTGVVTAASMIVVLAVILGSGGPASFLAAHSDVKGAFYAVMSHEAMVVTFGIVAVLIATAFAIGFVRFWKDTEGKAAPAVTPGAFVQALSDTLLLRYLDGAEDGCAYPDETPSNVRRRFHHATFYGFALCFAATAVGTVFHYVLGWEGPPPIPTVASLLGRPGAPQLELLRSLPVILGSLGGIGLLIGPAGLLWLKTRRNSLLVDHRQNGMDAGFLVLLFLASLTGFMLTALRETTFSGPVMVAHLGIVMGLFLTMPYGKFVHGIYRFGALLRNAVEKSTMPTLGSE
ncbi:tricarballylate utilization 4Fe-4S protein TcuB [Geomonas propionica]|uniref:Tricarballylate utilization 4Fe-4S protein TcuB n=1 Tax=Geomonas propionica TaxID=2798582 RepID=A0ABS0YQN1_9BACT|nr:tricarballylate utilization 4Fe-4S protein TcuB [Geomonas propionica]MBJ6799805.1 tricarballylate utilization 4Fe-4S protein TcuB [Geomonas propionica]